ncbi:hypothetical protein ACFQ3Z_00840 [Streptomyces nogalater]
MLAGAIESGDHGYDASDEALVEALHLLVLLCWYGGEPALWQPLLTFVDRLTPNRRSCCGCWCVPSPTRRVRVPPPCPG